MLKRFISNIKSMVTGLSWVGKLNVYLFQWLFFRLAYAKREKVVPTNILPVRPSANNSKYKLRKFSIMFPIIPLTGWWNDYKPQRYFTIKLYKK